VCALKRGSRFALHNIVTSSLFSLSSSKKKRLLFERKKHSLARALINRSSSRCWNESPRKVSRSIKRPSKRSARRRSASSKRPEKSGDPRRLLRANRVSRLLFATFRSWWYWWYSSPEASSSLRNRNRFATFSRLLLFLLPYRLFVSSSVCLSVFSRGVMMCCAG